MGFAHRKRGGGGAGIEVVKELPRPKKGAVVYVEADYPPSGYYDASDFNIRLTAGAIQAGYTGYELANPPSSIAPVIPGLNQLGTLPGGAISVILSGALLNAFGNGSMTVRINGDEAVINKATASQWIGVAPRLLNAGDVVTVQLFQTGTEIGVTSAGLRTLGDRKNPDEDLIPEDYYHVDPETMTWVQGLGGDGGGGIPGAILPETGMSDADKRNELWKGILVGLAREEAGIDWALQTVAGNEEEQATVTLEVSSGGSVTSRTVITIDAGTARGTAGNDWRLSVQRGTSTRAAVNTGARLLFLVLGAGATFSDATNVMQAYNRTSASIAGDGTAAIPDSLLGVRNFAGGAAADELDVVHDDISKTITLTHLVGHTQQELITYLHERELDEDTTLYATLINGSAPAASPEAAPQSIPFSRIYSNGSLPRTSESDLSALRQEIADLTFADIGGMIADSQIPALITRDAEITRAFLLNILTLTQQQLNDLFTGAAVSGSGASRVITVTQKDGSTITLAVPDTTGGTGGSGSDDGVITGASFAADGTTLTVTRSVGANIVVNVPSALRQAGLSQSQVNALIAAAEADDLDASDVARQIAATVHAGRGAYAGPLVLSGYTRQAQSNANPGADSYRSRIGTANRRGYTINLKDSDEHVGEYLSQFIGSTVTITGTDGTHETAGGANGTISAVSNVAGNIYLITIDSTAGFSASGVESDTGTWEISSALVTRTALAALAPRAWADIPTGTTITVGTVTEHGDAFFGCITQHNKSSTGPDGDAANWVLLSNWRGDWTNAWYPVGAMVEHNDLPWVATQAVVRNDPAPGAAANVKWLAIGSAAPAVVSASINTIIPAGADGHTYRATGSSALRFTLPDASGAGAVPDAWEVVIINSSSAELTVATDGSETIDGAASLALDAGLAVRIQKVADAVFAVIAKTEVGSTSSSATIADNSIVPAKAQADTEARKKAWRERLGSAKITAGSSLPTVATSNRGDVHIFPSDVASGLSFVDISDQDSTLDSASAGDILWLFMLRSLTWVRVGNLFTGGRAVANLRAVLDRNYVFGSLQLSPAGIPDKVFPENIALALANKLDARTIAQIQVSLNGESVATVNTADTIAPFNGYHTVEPAQGQPGNNVSQGGADGSEGGIINLALDEADRRNLLNINSAAQWVLVEVHYKFSGTSLALDVPADESDRISFGVNNNSFPRVQTAAEVLATANARAAAVAGPVIIISNIASYDATQNRFEDSAGNEVVVPNGTIVTLTQAVYDAAVADSGFTPNAAAIFLTSS